MTESAETFQFQAETKQLLDIVIRSLYSQKEIFLRELISNASDALDRIRLEALTNHDLLEADETLEIRLETDADARTLSLTDNWIGMTRAEVAENIGTIAKSGTRELVKRLQSSQSSDAVQLIGQFGVGFYSVFMVADHVTLVTRRVGEDKATRWSSAGDGTYELDEDSRFSHGTTVTLHLKPVDSEDGITDFTDPLVLQGLVKRYSDFVGYPIRARMPKPGADTKAAPEERVLNSMQPIWTRPANEVKDEEFTEFYRHVARDWGEPVDRLSLRAEGRLEYQALLFFPKHAPFDLYFRDQQFGLQLYVRRILIMDRCQNLLPPYLRFVKGIIDSADLPLNVSREMIQQDRHISQMQSWLSRKVLDHLQHMLETARDKFRTLWGEFGPVLKEGVAGEDDVKDRLLPLLLFQSSHDPTALTTLDEYVIRMKPEQTEVYYLTGESRAVIEHSPHLEAFQAKDYEVLYLVDPGDELLAQRVQEFGGKPFKSIGKGTVELGSEDERKKAAADLSEQREHFGSLLEFLQKTLDESIKEVRLSTRLTTSPVCLVGADSDMSPALERMLRQTQGADVGAQQKRILELNPKHAIAGKLQERFETDQGDPLLVDYAHLLLGYALLAEGSTLPDPARFNRGIGDLMVKGL